MFCPRCAAQNLDDAKFCRACGTNLETVALALADKYPAAKSRVRKTEDPFESWLETRKEGVDKIFKGFGLFMSSLLIGVALGLFSSAADWIIIWTGLVGWMACWGVISMVSGTAALMEARFMRRQIKERSEAAASNQSLPVSDGVMMGDALTPILPPKSSITEHTTTRLNKPGRTSKEIG